MKLVKSYEKIGNRQAGQVLPMALVLLAAAIFIVIPALFATQIGLVVNNDSEKDANAYYAAEAGIANALWKFKSGTPPFTSSSVKGDYYDLTNPAYTINGMAVRVTFIKYSSVNGIGSYIIQSAASSGSVTPATIVASIQSGTSVNSIFDQAVVSLNGDIIVGTGGACPIISDSTSGGNYGNIWANGNISVNGGKVGVDCKGTASATGTVTVNQWNGCVGVKAPGQAVPLSYAITISDFTAPALAGANYTSQAASKWGSGGPATYNVGPGYVNGNVAIGGSNTVVLTGNLYVKGYLKINGSGSIKGPYSIITDGYFDVSGGSSAILAAGNVPFIIVKGATVNIGSVPVAAVIYAPNAVATVSGGTPSPPGYNLYGSLIAKSVNISGSTTIKYMTGIYSETQIPGTQSGGASLLQYDYR